MAIHLQLPQIWVEIQRQPDLALVTTNNIF